MKQRRLRRQPGLGGGLRACDLGREPLSEDSARRPIGGLAEHLGHRLQRHLPDVADDLGEERQGFGTQGLQLGGGVAVREAAALESGEDAPHFVADVAGGHLGRAEAVVGKGHQSLLGAGDQQVVPDGHGADALEPIDQAAELAVTPTDLGQQAAPAVGRPALDEEPVSEAHVGARGGGQRLRPQRLAAERVDAPEAVRFLVVAVENELVGEAGELRLCRHLESLPGERSRFGIEGVEEEGLAVRHFVVELAIDLSEISVVDRQAPADVEAVGVEADEGGEVVAAVAVAGHSGYRVAVEHPPGEELGVLEGAFGDRYGVGRVEAQQVEARRLFFAAKGVSDLQRGAGDPDVATLLRGLVGAVQLAARAIEEMDLVAEDGDELVTEEKRTVALRPHDLAKGPAPQALAGGGVVGGQGAVAGGVDPVDRAYDRFVCIAAECTHGRTFGLGPGARRMHRAGVFAHVADPARWSIVAAREMRTEPTLATVNAGCVPLHRGQRQFVAAIDRGTRRSARVESTLGGEVARAEEQHAARWFAVTPCAAGLLIVGLDASRRLEVHDEADVGQVDPHAERVGRNQNACAPRFEGPLRALTREFGAPRVIVARRDSRTPEGLRDRLRGLAGAAVDETTSGPVPRLESCRVDFGLKRGQASRLGTQWLHREA